MKFKRLAAVAVAAVMGASALSLAACTSNEPTKKDTDPITPAVKQDTDAINETPAVTQAVSDLQGTAFGKIKLGANIKYSEKTLEDGETTNETYGGEVSALLDVEGGDADLYYAYDDSDGTTATYNVGYAFLRDWNIFTYSETESNNEIAKKTSFANVDVNYFGDVASLINLFSSSMGESMMTVDEIENAPTEEEEESAGFSVTDIANAVMSYLGSDEFDYTEVVKTFMSASLKYADAYSAVTVTDSAITVNENLLMYNILQSFNRTVASLSDKTTIKELLTCKTVYTMLAYVDCLGLKPAAIVDNLPTIFAVVDSFAGTALAENANTFKTILPAVEATDTMNTYLVKILDSTTIGSQLSSMFPNAKTLGAVTLGDIVTLVNAMSGSAQATATDGAAEEADTTFTVETLKKTIQDAISNYVVATETSFCCKNTARRADDKDTTLDESSVTDTSYTLSGMQYVFGLTSGKITSFTAEGKFEFGNVEKNGDSTETKCSTEVSGKYSVTVDFNSADSFTDISGAKVEAYSFADASFDLSELGEDLTYTTKYTATIASGVITIKDTAANVVCTGKLNVATWGMPAYTYTSEDGTIMVMVSDGELMVTEGNNLLYVTKNGTETSVAVTSAKVTVSTLLG